MRPPWISLIQFSVSKHLIVFLTVDSYHYNSRILQLIASSKVSKSQMASANPRVIPAIFPDPHMRDCTYYGTLLCETL